jgi:hypothetical protein
MAKRDEQILMEGASHLAPEQKQIRKLENQADKYDEKRSLVGGLETEMENIALKMREIAHENADDLSHEEGPNGEEMLVYRRGDYKIEIKKGKEKVNVKIKAASKGSEPDEQAEA